MVCWIRADLNIGSTYDDGLRSAPVEQSELVHRVNQAIDKCLEYMLNSVELDKKVYVDASDRMSGYVKLTIFEKNILIYSQMILNLSKECSLSGYPLL